MILQYRVSRNVSLTYFPFKEKIEEREDREKITTTSIGLEKRESPSRIRYVKKYYIWGIITTTHSIGDDATIGYINKNKIVKMI